MIAPHRKGQGGRGREGVSKRTSFPKKNKKRKKRKKEKKEMGWGLEGMGMR